MKRFINFLLICVLIVALTACNKDSYSVQGTKSSGQTEITSEDILSKLDDKEKSWMNISQSQYIEDFDQLYCEIQENYPYINVVYRKTGLIVEHEYAEYRERIAACSNDVNFYGIVREFIDQMQYVGHISTWGYRYSSEVDNLRKLISQFPQYEDQLAPYIEKLDNPVSKRNYQAMMQFYEDIDLQLRKANELILTDITDTPDDTINEEESLNVETKILRDGEIAYVKINGFDMDAYTKDKELLLPFYKKVADYDHIIIDITDNYGGGMDYFNNLVVAPLIAKPLTVSTYMLTKGGENNKEFLQIDENPSGSWKKINLFPALPELNADDLKQMDYFMLEDYTIEPLYEKQNYKGKVWMLVSSNNYSSSEYAAMFSKHSGFATLVGQKTGGDGIGVDPAYIILHNSGLVIQYSPVYGVTEDGTGSEEFGTMPDILALVEASLDTCLKIIDSKKLDTTLHN